MARKPEDHPIVKHTLNLYQGDYETLQEWYGRRIGAAKIVRDLVRAHIMKVRGEAEQRHERQNRATE